MTEQSRMATIPEGRVYIEVIPIEDDPERPVWVYEVATHPAESRAGELQGPFDSREDAESAVRGSYGPDLQFEDVPEGWSGRAWVTVPIELRDQILAQYPRG